MILHLQKILPDSFCKRIIELGEVSEAYVDPGCVSNMRGANTLDDIVERYRPNRDFFNAEKVYFTPEIPGYDEVRELCIPMVEKLFDDYEKAGGERPAEWLMDYFSLIRYPTGGYFHSHYDTLEQPNGRRRTVTVLLYLNDDFKGGELHFPHLEIFYTPRKGDVIIFPCGPDYIHTVAGVAEGVRYTMSLWPLINEES